MDQNQTHPLHSFRACGPFFSSLPFRLFQKPPQLHPPNHTCLKDFLYPPNFNIHITHKSMQQRVKTKISTLEYALWLTPFHWFCFMLLFGYFNVILFSDIYQIFLFSYTLLILQWPNLWPNSISFNLIKQNKTKYEISCKGIKLCSNIMVTRSLVLTT